MPVLDNWPMSTLPPKDLNWWPSGGVDNGGASLSGLMQLDRLDGGPIWRCSLLQIPIWEREQTLAFQAMQIILAGGATPVVVPRQPNFRSPAISPAALVPHSDGTPFSDETLYAGPTIAAVLVGDHELRAYQLTMNLLNALPLVGGEDFSINHTAVGWRMYRISRVRSVTQESDGSTTYEVEIGPTLRDDVDGGTILEFDQPRCAMRLTDPDSFSTALTFNLYGFVDASFEEAFWA